MKIITNSVTCLRRATHAGAVLGVAIFAASSLQAQSTDTVPAAPSTPVPATSVDVSHSEKEFLQFAAQANQTEITMADMAETRSQNPTVKALAQMMRHDHQQNYKQLQQLAQNHSIALNGTLDVMNRRAVHHLEKASDADFDKDYTKAMLKDHVKAITTFDKAVADMKQPDVLAYAQNTLPTLRKHLHHSEDAARAAGLDESAISSILKGLPSEESHAVTFNQN